MRRRPTRALAVLLAGIVLPLARAQDVPPAAADGKIRFDLSRLNDEGLQGPPGGRRALSYEFCIPADSAYAAEVRRIDTTLTLQRGAPGRVGCGGGAYLGLGSTHQPGFADVLRRLAALPYVERIEESVFE